ncbi:hypothetical protein NPIL_217721 [Nephila pilipes]|uniref:Uncharacterized protein n=1 Tax=Nephila pilipes TaxID=299642 RepID=A0A8X6Q2T4_NEPPI|nr:hypothetical protein NPIL_217721 [Nephila pilipes]
MDFTCFSRLTDVSLKESKQNRLTEMLPSTWSMSSPLSHSATLPTMSPIVSARNYDVCDHRSKYVGLN